MVLHVAALVELTVALLQFAAAVHVTGTRQRWQAVLSCSATMTATAAFYFVFFF
jgi:hypothetical protein